MLHTIDNVLPKVAIKSDRLHFDYRASDRITNFTPLVDELQDRGIDSVYLVTSKNHIQ